MINPQLFSIILSSFGLIQICLAQRIQIAVLQQKFVVSKTIQDVMNASISSGIFFIIIGVILALPMNKNAAQSIVKNEKIAEYVTLFLGILAIIQGFYFITQKVPGSFNGALFILFGIGIIYFAVQLILENKQLLAMLGSSV